MRNIIFCNGYLGLTEEIVVIEYNIEAYSQNAYFGHTSEISQQIKCWGRSSQNVLQRNNYQVLSMNLFRIHRAHLDYTCYGMR